MQCHYLASAPQPHLVTNETFAHAKPKWDALSRGTLKHPPFRSRLRLAKNQVCPNGENLRSSALSKTPAESRRCIWVGWKGITLRRQGQNGVHAEDLR
jgi:hypothetical protein